MKKITLLFAFLLTAMTWQTNAQAVTDNFDSYVAGDDPTGWTKYQTETDDPGFIVTDDHSSSAPNSLYHNDDSVTNESTSWIVAPVYTSTGGDMLSFDYYQNYTANYYNYSGVWYSTTGSDPIANPGDWTQIAEFNDTDQPYSEDTWTQFKHFFNEAAGTTIYVAFKYTGNWSHEFYIDNFSIDVAPPIFELTTTTDCNNAEFSVDVNVSDFSGGNSVTITDDQGSSSQQLNAPGTVTFGPYPAGLNVLITVTNDLNVSGTAVAVGYCTPDCADNPTPADGASSVTVQSGRAIELSWDAPTSGSIPSEYKVEIGTSSGSYVGAFNTPDPNITFVGFNENTTYYWKVTPISGTNEAVGCPEWSFTTDAFPTLANDMCSGAIALNVDADACVTPTVADNSFATDSGEAAPSCADYQGGDLWYTVTVPQSGSVSIEASEVAGSHLGDTGMAVYSGDCTNGLTEIICDDDGGQGFFSMVELTGQTPGEVLYVRVWEYGNNRYGEFNICAWDPNASAISDNTIEGFKFYPNPVDNTLNLSAQDNIEMVSISNITGQEVIKLTPNQTQTLVDMSRLPNGIYFVKAQVNGEVTAFKVVKK
jgi:hypothetical protein